MEIVAVQGLRAASFVIARKVAKPRYITPRGFDPEMAVWRLLGEPAAIAQAVLEYGEGGLVHGQLFALTLADQRHRAEAAIKAWAAKCRGPMHGSPAVVETHEEGR